EGSLRLRNFGCEESRRHAVAERLLGGQLPDGQAAARSDGEGRLVAGDAGERALAQLDKIAATVESRFKEGRRVLSFQEYLELFATNPGRFARDAARYMRDMFDFYGTTQIERPWGTLTRFKLFDLPWESEGHRRDALVGQEEVQSEIYRVLSNFAQEGRPNKLVLLHGPNGSSKSTVAACMIRALSHS